MRRWLETLLDLVLPAACEVCDAPLARGERALCGACVAAMVPPTPPWCAACGVPFGGSDGGLCPACRTVPPAFATARAAGLYVASVAGGNVLARAVQRLKYDRRRALARVLGDVMATRYPFGAGAVVVPVPLHARRARARGFNQAELLAARLARRRGLRLAATALRRARPTAAQPGLGAEARRTNLRDAFVVAPGRGLAGCDVVLVDDVMTTGATADACARVLRAAGARRVDVFTLGRAPAPCARAAGPLAGPARPARGLDDVPSRR